MPAVATAQPTVFHITHWKAGSQWIHRIFHGLAYHRLVLPAQDQSQFLRQPIERGKIYPTLYVTREEFQSASPPADHRRFVIFRDLRDTLVSVYFSCKVSHAVCSERFARDRARLLESSMEDGLLWVMESRLPMSAAIQQSWVQAGEPFFRYEDLIENDLEMLREVLIEHCQLDVPAERFTEVVLANRFERITGGRRLGQEDVNAHERQGAPGDWRNYFTDRVKRVFKDRFGELLVATGYVADQDW
jgi:lipopolysaccharide transport system ATP-binding protein